jgi:hypothetical protein
MRSPSGVLAPVSAKKSQALLAYLAVKPGQRVSRDKLAALLWSSTGPEQGRQSLRQTLSTLRKELATFSPDEKKLYVVDTGVMTARGRASNIRVFDVNGDKLANGKIFAANFTAGVTDGMRTDVDGNVWCSMGNGDPAEDAEHEAARCLVEREGTVFVR